MRQCGGVFTSIELARKAAMQFIKGERDHYHDYHIESFDMDTPLKQFDGGLKESRIIMEFKRDGCHITTKSYLSSSQMAIDISELVINAQGKVNNAPAFVYVDVDERKRVRTILFDRYNASGFKNPEKGYVGTYDHLTPVEKIKDDLIKAGFDT